MPKTRITLTLFVAAAMAACTPAKDDGDPGSVDAGIATDGGASADAGPPAACEIDADCEPVCGAFSECAGFEDTCQQNGTRSRTCDDMACVAGECVAKGQVDETVVCMRDTEGTACGEQQFACGACGEFDSTCDEVGTKVCTETNFACSAGACAPIETATEEACVRDTAGAACDAPVTTCGACVYESECDNTGAKSCQTTTYSCGGGACEPTTVNSTVGCVRNTDGDVCDVVVCGAGTGFGTRDLCCSAGSCNDICSPCEAL